MGKAKFEAGFTASVRRFPWLIRLITRLHIWLYRATRGRIGSRIDGSDCLLLTTRGRRSGREYTTPLYYLADGSTLAVVASYAGAPDDPAWWKNLKKDPWGRVEVRDRVVEVRARQATEEEKAALWPRFVAMYGAYDEYQKFTQRSIPVVLLEPAAPPSSPGPA